jgi:polyhydroxyalkanoate synthesis regulator phasin
MTWSDEETSASENESADEMVNLALVGLEPEQSGSDTSDSDCSSSEVKFSSYHSPTHKSIFGGLTLQEHNKSYVMEIMELKNENNELEKKNAHLKKIISELMAEKTPAKNHNEAISELKSQISQLEGTNRVMVKRNDTLLKELRDLKKEIEDRDACLAAFKLDESSTKELSQQAAKIEELEAELKKLHTGMGKFVQGEEALIGLMNQRKVPVNREGLGLASTSKDQEYKGRNGKPYEYAMPWDICRTCGEKGHLPKFCKGKGIQTASWRRKDTLQQQAVNNRRTGKSSTKVVQMWIKKTDLNVLYILSTNHAGPNKIWVPKR